MPTPILVARDIHKTYGSGASAFAALRGISLSIAKNESVAIVGKSGSGKSTLMHLLALLDAPSAGSIEVLGKRTETLSTRAVNQLRNHTFGFVFQQFFMIPSATVLENVMLPLTIAGMPAAERRARAIHVLEQVELADKASNRATNLSGGQKQRMVIARALANTPQLIFADEPTGNLDSQTSAVVEDLLFSLQAKAGNTLVIVTHDEDLAAKCDRQLLMVDGRIEAEGAA